MFQRNVSRLADPVQKFARCTCIIVMTTGSYMIDPDIHVYTQEAIKVQLQVKKWLSSF